MADKKDDIKDKDWQEVAVNGAEDDAKVVEDDGIEQAVAGIAGLEHPDYQQLEDKLTAAEQQAHDNWDKAMRAMSELDNARKRAARDVENAHKFALEKFSKELLPIVDSLEQAMQASSDEQDNVKQVMEGIELTHKLFLDVLIKFNIQQLDPVGEAFDPNLHEAMSMQENDEVKPGTVLVVFQKGYTLNERVIRPARVIVAKGQANSVDETA